MTVEVEVLPSVTLFRGLTDEQMRMVALNSRVRTYKAGVAIMQQLDPGQSFFVILEGTVKVSLTMPDGSEVFLAVLAAGDTVGELSLIDAGGRSADVTAQEPTRILEMDRELFDTLLASGAEFPRNLMRILSRRLRLANVRIQAHCTLDTFGMVAHQLLEFAELYGVPTASGATYVPIRLTQSDLATLIGASRERVNQVMVAYKKSGIITVDSRFHITVERTDMLRKRINDN